MPAPIPPPRDAEEKTLRRFTAERLTERLAALESDRMALESAVMHMKKGKLPDDRLTDSLRVALARASHGVVLETITAEVRAIERYLAELSQADDPEALDFRARAEAAWSSVDAALLRGEVTPAEAIDDAYSHGLLRRSQGLSLDLIDHITVCEPSRDGNLVPGPLLLVVFDDTAFGSHARFFRPVSLELRADTGLLS
jgi:hypothetical protein